GHFLASGQHRNVLIVSSDVAWAISNRTRPESFILFGDGAAAAVVTRSRPEDASQLDAYILRTFGSGAAFSQIKGWGTARHPNAKDTERDDNYFSMDGFSL